MSLFFLYKLWQSTTQQLFTISISRATHTFHSKYPKVAFAWSGNAPCKTSIDKASQLKGFRVFVRLNMCGELYKVYHNVQYEEKIGIGTRAHVMQY